jgi:hypothetical protein
MTAQISENLKYKDEELSMCANPLDVWLRYAGKDITFGLSSTACWRGYVGSWEIVDNYLYLVSVDARDEQGNYMGIKRLFPDSSLPVFAHWYSGEVRCPKGRLLEYVHGGYASSYEKDLFLKFERGVLVKEWEVNNGIGDIGSPTGYGVGAYLNFPIKKVDK